MDRQIERSQILRSFGATPALVEEVLAYNSDAFDHTLLDSPPAFPLPDEAFVAEWEEYARDAAGSRGIHALADRLVQLSFPVRQGMSETDAYIAVTRRGVPPGHMEEASGIELENPTGCGVSIHPTWAGRLPLIVATSRADFVSLIQAFTMRNEPRPVPRSMGACIVAGYNNWNRFSAQRQRWSIAHPDRTFTMSCIAEDKAAYQDRFVILSDHFYSDVSASDIGLDPVEWRSLSRTIRAEHESAHYWTRRVLSSMRNYVIDEIIADYCGIVAACGRFRADWLLMFLGLERFPDYRQGARLENYRGVPPLSDRAFALLQCLVTAAAANLDVFDRTCAAVLREPAGRLLALTTFSKFTLEELASHEAPRLLAAELARTQLRTVTHSHLVEQQAVFG